MAFDQSTRNRLQKFVNDARMLLTEEFTRQLQATYGLDPKAGSVAAADTLTHLDNRQRQTAHVLRETLAHYLATTHGKGEVDCTKQALSRIVREQAFTVLNRLAALRMAEARGFLLESIAKGYNSKGFQLYKQLAGSAQGETGDAYRNYLYSLFDEFSLDLAVLFDRHSAQGRLFPRESALLELLDLINHFEIEPLWGEDETIGWIYQYFNSQEERKKMRAESQAPRNSRELAVRNQFFTPRYVVEFLTDNTLGRIWYEMTQGNTRLVDSCRYLARRPTEVFLQPGEQAPEQSDGNEGESLSQEELLQQPVYIPFRAMKDPRCIRMLDPACGSMHFGLYAFDLFERIYEEAWQLEVELGAEAFVREGDLKPLHQTYGSFEDFKTQIPRLIIEHNIHGVDIDPRAVQIAGLSLWQRAQRAWQQQGIKPQQRPVVRKSNIVCAEPMPGEKELLQEFASSLNPPVLGQLLESIFDKMELAGEAGTLLKIEEEIQASIHEARDQWQARSGAHSVGDMFQAELDQATPQKKLGFDLSGVDDESFWERSEQLILEALSDYADTAESNADQKRLFSEDAAKGFAFIDLCRKRFDLVLMNPPFGEPSILAKKLIEKDYPDSKNDIYSCFIDRAKVTLSNAGFMGAITSKTGFFLSTFEELRKDLVENWQIEYFLDLGDGVLDAAMVKTAAYVFQHTNPTHSSTYVDLTNDGLKDLALLRAIETGFQGSYHLNQELFNAIPGSPFAYWVDRGLLSKIIDLEILESPNQEREVRQGMATSDDFRFIRLAWEVPPTEIGQENGWVYFAKGGDSTPFYSDIHLLVNWRGQGKEIKQYAADRWGSATRTIKSIDRYFQQGLTYTSYTNIGFKPRILPSGCAFSVAGMHIYLGDEDPWYYLAILNSSFTAYFLKLITDGRKFDAGYVKKIPIVQPLEVKDRDEICSIAREIYYSFRGLSEHDETSGDFVAPLNSSDIKQLDSSLEEELNKKIWSLVGYDFVPAYVEPSTKPFIDSWQEIYSELKQRDSCLSWAVGVAFGRFHFNSPKMADGRAKREPFDEIRPMLSIEINSSKGCVNSSLGILIDEIGHKQDLVNKISHAIEEAGFKNEIDIRDWLRKDFFKSHLKIYSKSRRQAPIYWPLQTSSGSYTLWASYHGLNEQTLYICVNDFIEGQNGKLTQVEQDLNALRGKSARSNQEEKFLEQLTDLEAELRDFRDELLRIAKFWKPNLNDGVLITAAPLWKLFQHKAWQKKLKETWESLEKGDYDWAHLACSIWPERVLRKCHQDRSLAIAHDVEVIFWHEVEVSVKRGKKATGKTKLEWQSKDLTDAELDALVQAKIKEMNA